MEEMVRDESLGIIRISDEVVSVIAGIAASEINGVYEYTSNVASIPIFQIGKKNVGKGVKVTVNEDEAVIDMILAVSYGVKIPEIISQVQENVKKTVEVMTGLKVSSVNISVHNIVVPKEEKEQKEK
ncbi:MULTISPECIES: Asp23/Gls24 family envelope stress response protein [Clostridium]|uniref:Asp23/Gls24 family envelope stress response protein n=1 Tax=Clostridium paridis TaxID=2803863 RepID=A0A937K229_9CLOT|nr:MULTISPECIES: Asp23/Gls24 family envelope stress response protein [Clostridium]MBL4931016.1 Asp23/Gls24 family envelope stress response protein [Clostridium paridis]